jgi:hypothetical protein
MGNSIKCKICGGKIPFGSVLRAVLVDGAWFQLPDGPSTGYIRDHFLQADFWILIRTFSAVRCWFGLAGVWFSCLERLPVTQEVAGSSPVAPAKFRNSCDCFWQEDGIG